MSDQPHEPSPPELDVTYLPSADAGLCPEHMIGPYRLVQKVGEGGMGVVWEVEQRQPVRRRLALKVIKLGMDTEEVVRRFESERQALALMNHPHIARVIDAGATAEGRPYFAMEYVPGEPIHRYCDRHRLTTVERLGLLVSVCEAIQHAHQKGVIHRDLKPSNVLVHDEDNRHVPKIIDFGIAKAISRRLTDKTLFTQHGQLLGTPEYMSPEQAEMGGDIDTRTDVYQLGVMLYELLTGHLPFDTTELQSVGFETFRRRILENDPEKPSTKATRAGDAGGSARARRTDPAGLSRQLRGDLDWIAMKALEKDRVRRYESPSALAADIGRFLRHEPIVARPPSPSYRISKFARRHRVGVVFAAVLLTCLVGFAVTMTFQARRIARERDRANEEANTASRVSDFLVDLFQVSDPDAARGTTLTARELLDRGARSIQEDLRGQPKVQARLMRTIGEIHSKLGESSQARPLLESALAIEEQLEPPDLDSMSASMFELAVLAFQDGRFDEAERLLLRTVETRRALHGERHPDTLRSVNALANVYNEMGRYTDAEPMYRAALDGQIAMLGEDSPDALKTMNNLAALLHDLGRTADAEALYVRALAGWQRTEGTDHPRALGVALNLSTIYSETSRQAQAIGLLENALDGFRRTLGENHSRTLTVMNNLGNIYLQQGRLAEAEELTTEVVERSRRTLGPTHPETLSSVQTLASVHRARGRRTEAESLFHEVLDGRVRVFGERHPKTLETVYELALLHAAAGETDAALAFLRRAIDGGFTSQGDLAGLVGAEEFSTLKSDPRFQSIVARLENGRP